MSHSHEVDESVLVWFSKQRRNCFRGARCLSCKSVKGLSFVNWDVGGGSIASISVCNALVVVRWRASWSLVLLAMIWFPSSDNCVEDCISVSSSEGGTTRVGAMLDSSLLDWIED